MSQALLISDHEVLNDIYAVNLKAYVATNVTIQTKLEDALKLLELNSSFDLIIAASTMGDIDCAETVYNYLKDNSIQVPFIVIGDKSSVSNSPELTTLPANYNIQHFIRTIAKILEIKAKDMAELEVPEFYPIPLKLFRRLEQIDFDVYYRVSKSNMDSEYIKILEKNAEVRDIFERYEQDGVKNLYIDSTHRLKFINFATLHVLEQLDKDMGPAEQIDVVEQGFEVVADQFANNDEVTKEMIDISRRCVSTVKDAVKSIPKIKQLMANMLENKTGFLYMHSVLATYVASHIIENISWGAEEHADKIAFVLFFHDMYLTPLYIKYPELKYEDDLLFSDTLTDKDKELVINHARMAGEVVKTIPRCPLGADVLTTQHHGITSGIGFTMDYRDDVSPLAKVIIVAEAYVEELLKQKDERPGETIEGDLIIERLNEKFKMHTYKKIIHPLKTISF